VDLHGETISYKALEKLEKPWLSPDIFTGNIRKPMGFLPSLVPSKSGVPLHLEDLEAISNINIIQDCFGKGM
jgi:hypothetical protein